MISNDLDLERLGSAIRRRRQARGLTVVDLAERAGFSASYISQLERGQVNISVSALKKIADVLDVQLVSLFEDDSKDGDSNRIVVRKNERKTITYPGSNVRNELLVPDLNRQIEFIWASTPPGSNSGNESYCHAGEECGLVIKGKMGIWVGDQCYILDEGDSISFKSSTPHRWQNIGDEDLEIVWVITPPSF